MRPNRTIWIVSNAENPTREWRLILTLHHYNVTACKRWGAEDPAALKPEMLQVESLPDVVLFLLSEHDNKKAAVRLIAALVECSRSGRRYALPNILVRLSLGVELDSAVSCAILETGAQLHTGERSHAQSIETLRFLSARKRGPRPVPVPTLTAAQVTA